MSSCIYSGNTVGVFPDLLYVPVRAWLGKPKEDNVSSYNCLKPASLSREDVNPKDSRWESYETSN